MYRKLFLFSFCCFTSFALVCAQANSASSDEILGKAFQQAAAEKKNVFVLFHASWCGWCRKMDTAMNDAAVKKFFTDHYIITHLVVYESAGKKNLEHPGAEDLLKKYHGNDKGIPYWLIFDKDGKLLADSKHRPEGAGMDSGDNVGCPATEKEVAHFIEVLKKTSSLRPEQLDTIARRFRQNEY